MNTMKLLGKGDLKLCRLRHQGSTHYFISVAEMCSVQTAVGETGYYLYSYYRTGFFDEAEDFDDETVGNKINWPSTKVKKYRLILENAALFRKLRLGTKADGITKVFVGQDTVALYDAGLPADILDGKAFLKLKRALKITTIQELIENVELMVNEYARNPELYK
jgi:hypothetical protein